MEQNKNQKRKLNLKERSIRCGTLIAGTLALFLMGTGFSSWVSGSGNSTISETISPSMGQVIDLDSYVSFNSTFGTSGVVDILYNSRGFVYNDTVNSSKGTLMVGIIFNVNNLITDEVITESDPSIAFDMNIECNSTTNFFDYTSGVTSSIYTTSTRVGTTTITSVSSSKTLQNPAKSENIVTDSYQIDFTNAWSNITQEGVSVSHYMVFKYDFNVSDYSSLYNVLSSSNTSSITFKLGVWIDV